MRSLSEGLELHGARGGGKLGDAIEIGLIGGGRRRIDRAVQLDDRLAVLRLDLRVLVDGALSRPENRRSVARRVV